MLWLLRLNVVNPYVSLRPLRDMVTSSCLAWVTFFLVFRFGLAGWGGTDDDDTWPSAGASSSSDPGPPSRQGQSKTEAEVALHMLAAWDEELCLALQDEEIGTKFVLDEVAPDPLAIPVPFGVTAARPVGPQEDDLDGDGLDWLELVRDRRRLRCRTSSPSSPSDTSFQASSSTSSSRRQDDVVVHPGEPASSTSTLAGHRDPASLMSPACKRPGILKKGKWGDVQPEECTASSPCANSSPSSSQSSSSLTPLPLTGVTLADENHEAAATDEEPGITRRFGLWRTGRDRWHNPDGSVIRRSGNMPATLPCPSSSSLATIHEEGSYSQVDGASMVTGEPVVHDTTCCGEDPADWVNDSAPCGSSTTAGEDTVGGYSSATSSASSEGTDQQVGFWRHGVWQPRSRTPEEARAHAGGRGAQRMERKNRRMQDWLQGTWRPAWLVQYAKDKAARQDAQNALQPTTPQPLQVDTLAADHTQCSAWHQDPLTGWWSQEAPPTSLASCSWDGITSWSETGGDGDELPEAANHLASAHWTGWVNWHDWSDLSTWHGWGDLSTCSSSSSRQEASRTSGSWTWTSTSTTSTTSSSSLPVLPNHGLFPDVTEVVGPIEGMATMEMTGAERRRLQEVGVPADMIQRLEDIFAALDRHQVSDRGPESRWAIARFMQRANEGLEALDIVMGIIARRLAARGVWPIERVPRTEPLRWNLFQWARSTALVLQRTLEWHLATPLQPTETSAPQASLLEAPAQHSPPASSASGAEGGGGHGDRTARSRSPPGRSYDRSPTSLAEPESNYIPDGGHADEDADGIAELASSSSSSARGLTVEAAAPVNVTMTHLPQGIQQALSGQLLGVWCEPSPGSGNASLRQMPRPVAVEPRPRVLPVPALHVPALPEPALPALPVRQPPVRLGVVPRLRAGASGGGAEGDGNGAGSGEPHDT